MKSLCYLDHTGSLPPNLVWLFKSTRAVQIDGKLFSLGNWNIIYATLCMLTCESVPNLWYLQFHWDVCTGSEDFCFSTGSLPLIILWNFCLCDDFEVFLDSSVILSSFDCLHWSNNACPILKLQLHCTWQ